MTRSLVIAALSAATLIPTALRAQDDKPADKPLRPVEQRRVEVRRVKSDVEQQVDRALRQSIESRELREQILKSVHEAMAEARKAQGEAEEVRREVKVEKTVRDGDAQVRVFVNGKEVDPQTAGIELEMEDMPAGVLKMLQGIGGDDTHVIRMHSDREHGDHEHGDHEEVHEVRVLTETLENLGIDGAGIKGLKFLESLPLLKSAHGNIVLHSGDLDIEELHEHIAELHEHIGKPGKHPFSGSFQIELDGDDMPKGVAGILESLKLGGNGMFKIGDADGARAFAIRIGGDDEEECCDEDCEDEECCDEDDDDEKSEGPARVLRWLVDADDDDDAKPRAFAFRVGSNGDSPRVIRGLPGAVVVRGSEHPQVVHEVQEIREGHAHGEHEHEHRNVDPQARVEQLKAEIQALRKELKELRKSMRGNEVD